MSLARPYIRLDSVQPLTVKGQAILPVKSDLATIITDGKHGRMLNLIDLKRGGVLKLSQILAFLLLFTLSS